MSFDFSINLAFSNLPQEISEKRESMFTPHGRVAQALLDFGRNTFGQEGMFELNRTLMYIKNLRIESAAHSDMSHYIAHPIRLAIRTGYTVTPPHLDLIKLALLHNVYELTGLEEADLRNAGFSNYIQNAVRVLTMAREHEFDAQYLAGYYRKIEDFGREASLIKCLDKLDNILGLELMDDGDLKTRYLELALTLVGPMTYRLSRELGEYFYKACMCMQREGKTQ